MQLLGHFLLLLLPLGDLVAAGNSCSSASLAERDNDGAHVWEMIRREAAAEMERRARGPREKRQMQPKGPVCASVPSSQLPDCQARQKIKELQAQGCDFYACLGAAATCTAACATAAAMEFANPIADLACVGSGVTFIDKCKDCGV